MDRYSIRDTCKPRTPKWSASSVLQGIQNHES